MKRAIASSLLVFFLVGSSANLAGMAVSFPTISGKLTDVDGKAIANVAVYARSPGLVTDTCTKSDGSYKLQAKANQKVNLQFRGEKIKIVKGLGIYQGCVDGTDQSWYLDGQTEISTSDQNMTVNMITPKARLLKVKVVDDESNPVFGATVQPNSGLGYSGIVGKTRFPKSFNGWWSGFRGQAKITDLNGIATFGVFEVASQKEDIDAYCDYTALCIRGDGISEVSQMNLGKTFTLEYSPRPGVKQTDYPTFDWNEYIGDVVVPIIPDLTTVAPTSAKYLSTVTVTSVATISSALGSSSKSYVGAKASIGYSAAVKSPFSGKKASLYSRAYSIPSKPGVWKKISTCTYDKNGKCSVKLKFYATAQIQFRPEGFSSVLSTKKITKK